MAARGRCDAFCKVHCRRICSLLTPKAELVGAKPLHLADARPLCRLKAPLGLSLLRKREPEKCQRFRRAGSTNQGLLALDNPKEEVETQKTNAAPFGAIVLTFFAFLRFGVAARRPRGRQQQMSLPATAPPVKKQARKIRRFSGLAKFKIIFPLKIARAKRRLFQIVCFMFTPPRPRTGCCTGRHRSRRRPAAGRGCPAPRCRRPASRG